jgi:hypothetical protein
MGKVVSLRVSRFAPNCLSASILVDNSDRQQQGLKHLQSRGSVIVTHAAALADCSLDE